jgi:hypothetical protein
MDFNLHFDIPDLLRRLEGPIATLSESKSRAGGAGESVLDGYNPRKDAARMHKK